MRIEDVENSSKCISTARINYKTEQTEAEEGSPQRISIQRLKYKTE